MPEIDGPELVRRLRADPDRPYSYFILVTATDQQANAMKAIEAGADDYLTKPIDFEELEVRLVNARRITELHRRLGEQRADLERLNAEIGETARTDTLTRLGNRLRLDEDSAALDSRFKRYGHRYALAMLDLDHFKAYNDELGHMAGDSLLQAVAQAIVRTIRAGDAAYRYGGEEILVVLDMQSGQSAVTATERILEAIRALHINHPGNPPHGIVTASAGVAGVGDALPDYRAVLAAADAALYRAKDSGRNTLELAD
jgi:diguanylate cyclase (GGDEF)-like protein